MKSDEDRTTALAPTGTSTDTDKRMALIGQVEPFDESASDWPSYQESLKSFLRVNRIPENDHVDAFLSIIRAKNEFVIA